MAGRCLCRIGQHQTSAVVLVLGRLVVLGDRAETLESPSRPGSDLGDFHVNQHSIQQVIVPSILVHSPELLAHGVDYADDRQLLTVAVRCGKGMAAVRASADGCAVVWPSLEESPCTLVLVSGAALIAVCVIIHDAIRLDVRLLAVIGRDNPGDDRDDEVSLEATHRIYRTGLSWCESRLSGSLRPLYR